MSMLDVEGCLADRLLSTNGVLAAATRRAETGPMTGGGEGIAWWACTTALCGSDGGGRGRVEFVSCAGDGALVFASFEALGFLGFLPAALEDGEGVSRGES